MTCQCSWPLMPKLDQKYVSYMGVGYTRVGLALDISNSCCLSHFHLHWEANANAVSGGIWALLFS